MFVGERGGNVDHPGTVVLQRDGDAVVGTELQFAFPVQRHGAAGEPDAHGHAGHQDVARREPDRFEQTRCDRCQDGAAGFGAEADRELRESVREHLVVAAWGRDVPHRRVEAAYLLLAGKPVFCHGTTDKGSPRHPLYVPKTRGLVPFWNKGAAA